MRSIKRINIYAVCMIALSYIDYPASVIVCLAVAISLSVLHNMLRMCDQLLDPPPAIFRLLREDLRINSKMPPNLLTGCIEQSKHRPHSLANASSGRTRHDDEAT